jgi:hypothetical protein
MTHREGEITTIRDCREMSGLGGMLSILVKGGWNEAVAVASKVKLTIGLERPDDLIEDLLQALGTGGCPFNPQDLEQTFFARLANCGDGQSTGKESPSDALGRVAGSVVTRASELPTWSWELQVCENSR